MVQFATHCGGGKRQLTDTPHHHCDLQTVRSLGHCGKSRQVLPAAALLAIPAVASCHCCENVTIAAPGCFRHNRDEHDLQVGVSCDPKCGLHHAHVGSHASAAEDAKQMDAGDGASGDAGDGCPCFSSSAPTTAHHQRQDHTPNFDPAKDTSNHCEAFGLRLEWKLRSATTCSSNHHRLVAFCIPNWWLVSDRLFFATVSGFAFTASYQHPGLQPESRMLLRSREGESRQSVNHYTLVFKSTLVKGAQFVGKCICGKLPRNYFFVSTTPVLATRTNGLKWFVK